MILLILIKYLATCLDVLCLGVGSAKTAVTLNKTRKIVTINSNVTKGDASALGLGNLLIASSSEAQT